MLSSIKLFLRSLRRNKLFAFVNILGLTVGFFASILIYLYVENEMSYDQFHERGDHILRVNQTFIWGDDNDNRFSSTGPGVGYSINLEIPEVKHVTRVHTPSMMPITFELDGEQKFFKDEVLFAVDSNFLEVFTFPLKYGDPSTALDLPNSVILQAETATRFFGNEDPTGKLITLRDGELFTIRGVFKDDLPNSYVGSFDMIISMSSIERVRRSNINWMWTMFETYILLEEGADVAYVQSKLDQLPEKYAGETLGWMGYTYEEYLAAGKEWNLYLQPLKDIYLFSGGVYNRLTGVGDVKVVVAMMASSLFLIILSCINFINLSTSQFTAKAKDVALRKVLGGSKAALVRRFFGEAFFFSLISLTIACVAILYFIPNINQSLGTNLEFNLLEQPFLVLFSLSSIFIISLVTGFYPFVFFNAFKPVSTLKGEMKTGIKGIRVRNGMLITQYVLSFILIIGTITVSRQLDYFMNVDMGFNSENIVSIENVHWMDSQEEFVDELTKIKGVNSASLCDAVPLYMVANGDQFTPDEPDAGAVPLNYAMGDDNYIDLLEIEMLVGRNFKLGFATDTSAIILNETAAHMIGWPIDESILNKKITNWSGTYHVIGVTKDFNFWTLHAPIEPFAIFHSGSNAIGDRPLTRVMLKVAGTNEQLAEIDKRLEEKWGEFVPNRPYESVVFSDHLSRVYASEDRFGDVLSFFSALTIIIASLGLFGIVVFSIEQKLKEIGVRKVLGASIASLVMLFSKSYIKLLLVAFFIAAPFGYFFMEQWLSDFEYRIPMSPFIFVSAFGLLFLISLGISIFHTTKASLMNPAEVLKDE